jgi:hypothetical protein
VTGEATRCPRAGRSKTCCRCKRPGVEFTVSTNGGNGGSVWGKARGRAERELL